MENNTQQLLQEINEVSRQLLSQILSIRSDSKSPIKKTSTGDIQENSEIDNLTTLTNKRKELIATLFAQKTKEEIELESVLFKELLSFDNELKNNASRYKKELSEHVIKIKKGKKLKESYKKY